MNYHSKKAMSFVYIKTYKPHTRKKSDMKAGFQMNHKAKFCKLSASAVVALIANVLATLFIFTINPVPEEKRITLPGHGTGLIQSPCASVYFSMNIPTE